MPRSGKEQKGSAAIGMLVVERETIRSRDVSRGRGSAPVLPGLREDVMDAFDRFWQWADKPPESLLTIPAELHRAVLELAPEDRRDRAAVNQAAARVPDPE
jgi:hypothetical protein